MRRIGAVLILLIVFCVPRVEFPEVDRVELASYPGKIIGILPVRIVVRAYKNDLPVRNALVSLRAYPKIGNFSRESILTNENGLAVVYFYPSLVTDIQINSVSIEVNCEGIRKSIEIEFSFPNYVSALVMPEEIPYNGGSAMILLRVFDKSGSPISGVKVEFFPQSGEVIPRVSETDERGEVQVTYKSSASTGTQKINFSIGGIFQGYVPVTVLSPLGLGTILFLGFDPPRIALRDTGATNVSRAIFRVVDSFGNPLSGIEISFSIRGPNGGETLFPYSSTSDEDGIVSTYVISGTIPGPVRVICQARDSANRVVSVVSGTLHISSGIVSNRHFTVFPFPRAVPGFDRAGFPFSISAFLADRFGVSVPTRSNVVAIIEGGAVEFSSFSSLEAGIALFQGRTQEPMPQNTEPASLEFFDENEILSVYSSEFNVDLGDNNPRDGWVSIVVMTMGEEEFFDLNGNGRYDKDEPFVDQGEPFLDTDDDGEISEVCDYISWDSLHMSPESRTRSCEIFIDVNRNNLYDGPNGKFDQNAIIWKSTIVLFFGEIDIVKCLWDGERIKVLVADERGNPVPGTKIYKVVAEQSVNQEGETETKVREELMGEVRLEDFIPGENTTIFISQEESEAISSVSIRVTNDYFKKTITIPCAR